MAKKNSKDKSFSKEEFSKDRRSKSNKVRGNSRFDDDSFKSKIGSCKPNDWQWYAREGQLVKDSASYSYNYPIGMRLRLGEYGGNLNNTSIPGIMTIFTSTAYGQNIAPNSAINVAAKNVYSEVRYANSGSSNYDAPDLMLYLCALSEAHAYIAWIKRLYGLMLNYSQVNRYYAEAMVHAAGGNFEDLYVNLADFRAFINMTVLRIGSFVLPNDMSFVQRHAWMYSNAFLDRPDPRAQVYMYTPSCFHIFGLQPGTGAGCLGVDPTLDIYEEVRSGGCTFDFIKKLGEAIISPIVVSESMGIMGGDILKAYGENGVLKLALVDENYFVVPGYNEEVLDQIHNATLIGRPEYIEDVNTGYDDPGYHRFITLAQVAPILPDATSTKIWHYWPSSLEEGTLYSNWVFKNEEIIGRNIPIGSNAYLIKRFLDFDKMEVKPEDAMVASRLTNILELIDGEQTQFTCPTLGSDVAENAVIWTYAMDHDGAWKLSMSEPFDVSIVNKVRIQQAAVVATNLDDIADTLSKITGLVQQISHFYRHPIIYYTNGVAWGDLDNQWQYKYGTLNGFLGEVNHFTTVDINDLAQMSEVALLSEFAVKQLGRFLS